MLKSLSQGIKNMKPGFVVLIVIGVLALLAGIIFLLYKFVFEKNQLRRQIRELDRRFQYLHALLIGQDAQYVKRLEIISRTNLLYTDIHTKFLKRFKEVRDKHDAHAQSIINGLKDLADEKKTKTLKAALVDAKDSIAAYEKEVNTLNNELLAVVKPEEECHQASLILKEKLRRIKQDYYSKQSDLQLLNESFEEIFKYIDSQFEEFENFVESAQYDDANAVLPNIDRVLLELFNDMGELPNLCAMVISYIPERIASLENAYEVMQHDNYPLHHLGVASSIKEMKQENDELTTKIKQFNLRGVADRLNDIASRIDAFFNLFEEEKEARTIFEENNEITYQTVNTIERRFIKLCNSIPEVAKVYVINEDHQSKINSIQNDINKLGALKRSLDTFIHSSTKQPYSLLANKMKELDDASSTVIAAMDDFQAYISSLRSDTEEAYKIIYEYFYKIKENEKTVRDMDVENISTKYAEKFDRLYEIINSINGLLNVTPIDVDAVNEYIKELHSLNGEVLENGSIAQDYNMKVLAENAILYANRDRNHFADIDNLVSQAENLYNNGEFEQSYVIAGSALEKIRVINNEKK
ncbi:MAG: septation ring formation regulator EzrA [Bacilli bacterium]|nr:septation ring formation regulator EzrA [Bacilli bacterium]